ncbi:hypothetical protein [Roseibacillus persicicus]|uniref:Uncharacterized protein n=1 Tax=Roseibacillus persicicus TaxID=454148 RepID=A0A918WMG7_9BACT|nr:hypothetical protein [Roseibacillus persicicus]GHC56981.1 hypothetical protein GCM10007100_24750 [Roseibacillus persicicus]
MMDKRVAKFGVIGMVASVCLAPIGESAFLPEDVHWFYKMGGPRPEPFAFAQQGRYLYTGGIFTDTDGLTNGKNLVRFDMVTEAWQELPGLSPEINGSVRALHAGDDGRIYVGGNFSNVAEVPSSRVAAYDPQTGTFEGLVGGVGDLVSVGQENGPTNGDVRAILKVDDLVYVGGFYTGPSGSPANEKYIRAFNLDTNTWLRLGDGLDGQVNALKLLPDGSILAGGEFSEGLARWDGVSWAAYGGGVGGEGVVRDIELTSSGRVYIGGSFNEVGSGANQISANFIAYYEPSSNSWNDMAGGFDDEYIQSNNTNFSADGVYDLALAGDGTLYVGGDFQADVTRTNTNLDHVACWDSTGTWQSLGSGAGTSGSQIVNCVAVGPRGEVYVGGTFSEGYRNASSANSQFAVWDSTIDFRGEASERNYDYVPGARNNTTVEFVPGASPKFQFESRPGTDYRLEVTTDLASSLWTPTGPTVAGDGGVKTLDVTMSGEAEFYRLRAID